ncbi:MAG TPA: hypothetical protein VF529_19745 [Solirubrobacteraceae bacterium]
MADWNSLRNYIKGKYKIAEDNLDSLKLVFEVEDGRSQVAIVSKLGDTGWVGISTAVCRESEIDPRDALRRNAGMTVGGLALIDAGIVIFRHSFPLANLDPDEFEEPLFVVVQYGDQLERELSGGGDLW